MSNTAFVGSVIRWFPLDNHGICSRCKKHEPRCHFTNYHRLSPEEAIKALLTGYESATKYTQEYFEKAMRQQQENHFVVSDDDMVCYTCALERLRHMQVPTVYIALMGFEVQALGAAMQDPHTVLVFECVDDRYRVLTKTTVGEPNLLACIEEVLRGDTEVGLL